MRIITRLIMLSSLAVCLLVAAPQAQAGEQLFYVVSMESASGDVTVESDLCVGALSELQEQYFTPVSQGSFALGGNWLVGSYTLKDIRGQGNDLPIFNDVVQLFCAAYLVPGELGGEGEFGRPGKPGRPEPEPEI